MNTPILNRKLAATDQLPEWYQIEKSGEHSAGKHGTQVIDAEARAAMIAEFNPRVAEEGPVLIDLDHLSHDLKNSTEAYGWLHELRETDGELEGRIEWSDLGEPAVRGKRLRFFSTEYPASGLRNISAGKVRPTKLAGLALTNRPNNRGGKPILNTNQNEKNKNMNAIAIALGLAVEATEPEILKALAKLKADYEETKKNSTEASAEIKTVKEREAEEIMNRAGMGADDSSRPFWKEQLVTNREGAMKALTALKPQVKSTAPLHNRSSRNPEPVETGNEEADSGADQKRFVEETRLKNRCTHAEAWSLAKRQKPELFI